MNKGNNFLDSVELSFSHNRDELDLMVDFQVAMAWETEKLKLKRDVVKKGMSAVLSDSSKGRYLLAHHREELVAMLLTLPEWSDWRCAEVMWIHSVYVKPDHRGKKIFSKMYRFLQDIVTNDNNYAGLRLYVEKTNIRAQEVYRNLGMSREHYDLFEWLVK